MAFAEFPSSNMHDYDLHELLCMYKQLKDMYAGLVIDMGNLNSKLSAYINQVDSVLPVEVKREVDKQMFQVQSKLTELNNKLTSLEASTKLWVEQEANQRKKCIGSLNDKLEAYITRADNEFEELRQEIKKVNSELNNQIDALHIKVLHLYGMLFNKIIEEARRLDKRIDDLPDNSIPVRGPVTGQIETTTKALYDLYNMGINFHGFTAGEWQRSTYITCEYWQDIQPTAIDFFTHGKEILNYYWELNHVFSFQSGKSVTLKQAIYEIFNVIKPGAITVEEFDNKKIMASMYDGMNIKASCYDHHGKEIFKDV